MTDHVVKAEVISYVDECVGMYLDWESGRVSAYSVPDVASAMAELKRLGVEGQVTWRSPRVGAEDESAH